MPCGVSHYGRVSHYGDDINAVVAEDKPFSHPFCLHTAEPWQRNLCWSARCRGASLQGAVLRLLTYVWLRFYTTNTSSNPVYRMFTAMWTRCLKHSRERWKSARGSRGDLPSAADAGAASEDATTISEPLLRAQRESSNAYGPAADV